MALQTIGLSAILDDKNFQEGLGRYTSGVSQMEQLTNGAASILSGVFTAATGVAVAGLGALTAAIKIGMDTTLAWSENMDKLGDQFGMTGEQASAWTVAMNHVGLTVEEGAQGLNYFTKNLDDMSKAVPETTTKITDNSKAVNGLKEQLSAAEEKLRRAKERMAETKKPTDAMRYAVTDAQAAVDKLNKKLAETPASISKVTTTAPKLTPFGESLKKLGVSAYDAQGKMKTFDQIMPEIMDKFQKLPPGINASAMAMDLFGARGGSKFLDFLRQGSAGLKDATAFAKAMGLELSTNEVDAAEQFGFAMNDLNLGFTGIKNSIGLAVLPVMKDLVGWLNSNVIPAVASLAQQYAPLLGQALRDAGAWMGKFKDIIGATVQAFQQDGLNSAVNTAVTNFLMLIGVEDETANSLGDLAATIATNLVTAFQSLQTAISQFWTEAQPKLIDLQTWLSTDGVTALDIFYRKIQESQQIGLEWKDFAGKMFSDISGALAGINSDAQIQLPTLPEIVNNSMNSMNAYLQIGVTAFEGIWKAAGQLIQGDFIGWGQTMTQTEAAILEGLRTMAGEQLSGWVTQFQQAGQDMIRGMCQGAWNSGSEFRETLNQIVQQAIEALKQSLGIHSPSRVFAGIGANMAAGLMQGWGSGLSVPSANISASVAGRGYSSMPAHINLPASAVSSSRTLNFNFGSVYGVSDFDYRVRQIINAHDRGH